MLTGGPGAFDEGFKYLAPGNRPIPFTLIDDRGYKTPVCPDNPTNRPIAKRFGSVGHTPDRRSCSYAEPNVTILDRRLESVVGISPTWSSTLDGALIRA